MNFWGYDECWLYNQEIDFDTTINTADREKLATKLNRSGTCRHFKRPFILTRIGDWFEWWWWRLFR
jgi:hypothetical protein